MEDRELVQKILAKDEKAYEEFFMAYRDKIYRASVYILGYQDPDAEDVTQEVFLAALKQLPQFEFRSTLYHWLYRICMYLCYERVKKRRRLVVSLDEELETIAGPLARDQRDHEQEDAERRKMVQLVKDQKELMGDPCRNLLDLQGEKEKTYAEMADILKVPIGTVMSRLARCKESLKKLVEQALKGGLRG